MTHECVHPQPRDRNVEHRTLLMAVGLAACASGTPGRVYDLERRPATTSTRPDCADAARALAAGRLFDLSPLTTDCRLEAILGAVPGLATDTDHDGELGQAYAEASWRETSSGVAGVNFRAWHVDGNVVALELERPSSESWKRLRSQLGPPDAKLPYHQQAVPVPDGQWVYATRGLAFFTWHDDEFLDRVVVFAPTTVAAYQDGIAMDLQPLREAPFSE